MPQTLQAESKTKKLADLGRAIFKRQSGFNDISARSQRFFRASKARGIWKSGMKKARTQWAKVKKSKKAKRESAFDDLYPECHSSSRIRDFLRQDVGDTPLQSPGMLQEQRHSSSPSVTVTTPTPSNSQRNLGYRQSLYVVNDGGDEPSPEPSPLFATNPRRQGVTSFVHPVVSTTYSAPPTPTTTYSSDNYGSRPQTGSDQSLNRTGSDWTSCATSPDTAQFPGQVNPTQVAEKRQSQELKRLSHDILDAYPRTRDRLFSQRHSPIRRFSVPPQTPRGLNPGSEVANRPLTTHFEEPEPSSVHANPARKTFDPKAELPHLPYGPEMKRLTERLLGITGLPDDDSEAQASGRDDALAALTGRCAPVRVAEAVADYEWLAAMAQGIQPEYPGQGAYRPRSEYQPLKQGVTQKPKPVPAAASGRSRPPTPAVLRGAPKGKEAADPMVQMALKAAREKGDERHKRRSRMMDEVLVNTPSTIREWDAIGHDPSPEPVQPKSLQSSVRRKPVARQPSSRKPDTEKPLPKTPSDRSSVVKTRPRSRPHPQTTPAHRNCQCPDCPRGAPVGRESISPGRMTILEERIKELESRPVPRVTASTAAAGARAAATLQSAMVSGSAVPRGPHRARPSKRKNIHDMSQPREREYHQPTAGSVLRDVMTITKNSLRKKR